MIGAAGQTDLGELAASDIVDQFLERVVEDVPHGQVTGRLKRWQYAMDRIKLVLEGRRAAGGPVCQ